MGNWIAENFAELQVKMFEKISAYLGPRDPIMETYPLMETPKLTVIASILYLAFVLYIGPALMKNRRPFELRIPMIIYNIGLVALSTWIFLNCGIHGWFGKYNLFCEPLDFSNNAQTQKMVQVCWFFYVSKLIEYFDTIFFVLRKKQSQINFLHVYHHSTVPITSWFGVSYGPGGYNTLFPIANTFVHIWMYLYYGLAAMGPRAQRYLWWKKYLTTLQLLQFTVVFLYFLQLYLFAPKSCNVSPFLIWLSLGQAVIYFILFLNFYFKSYRAKPRRKVTISDSTFDDLEQQNGNGTASLKKYH